MINGKIVKAIEYSAYEGMVKAEADKIRADNPERIRGCQISMILSIQPELSMPGRFHFLLLLSAGHRKQAMEACSKAVELIKEGLPVWKKEIYEDDSHNWK